MTTKSRNLEKTRRHILDVAFLEIFKNGFQGVSVADIVAQTKVTKGAFFHHFPTKLDLGYALVDEVLKEMTLDRWIRPLAAYKNPLVGILKQMQKHIGGSTSERLAYGCPLNNLVQEMSAVDAEFKKRTQAVLNMWIDETAIYIERAQEAGVIKKTIRARDIAQFMVMAHEGFFGMIKGVGDKSAFIAMMASLKVYVDGMTVSTNRS